MSKPQILITGGTGYLGRWVADLARADWDVTATFTSKPGDLADVVWQQLDVRDTAAVAALIGELGPQVIVHTAALNPGQGNDYETVNVTGTANVAQAAAAAGSWLIHISTDMVFDGQRGSYSEEDKPNPLTEYGRSKYFAEEAVVASGVGAAIVRTSLIYGWRPTIARAAQWMLDALDRGEIVRLWSDEMRCPTWVESLAAAIVELAGLDHSGPIHIAGSQATSRYDFGVALLNFHGNDRGPVFATSSPPAQLRPRNCTLNCTLANRLLATPLPGVDEVLGNR